MADYPSIVFAADLHFDETGAWKYRGIVGDAKHSFTQIVDYCCKHRASVLALGGDILDKPSPHPDTIRYLNGQFGRLQEANVQVVHVLGQHDGRQDWPSIHPWPIHLNGRSIDVDGFTIFGLDYLRPADFTKAYAALAGSAGRFLLCHQVLREFMGNVKEAELALAELPYAMDFLVGDYHGHRKISYAARNGSLGVAMSPGATHARDVADEERKRFYAIFHGTLAPWAYQSVDLHTRPIRRFRVTTSDEAEKFLARLDELPLDGGGIERAVIDVSYYDDLDDFGAELARLLEDRCHLFARRKSRKRDERAPSAHARRAVADCGLAGAVSLVCEPGPVLDSSVRLLEAPDPRIELEAMRSEFFGPVAEHQEVA